LKGFHLLKMESKDIHKLLYPVQSSDFKPAHPPGQDGQGLDDAEKRVPKTLRAVRDANEEIKHPRTLVVCLDGTGDQFDADNTNIVNFVSCLKKHAHEEQVTYYQSGIGTYGKGGKKSGLSAALDMSVGSGLGVHVRDAYKFLMEHYHEGDKICLLGFSRGAYTVRCLAGMLHKVGLLPPSNMSQVEFAYNFYKDDTTRGFDMSSEFKKTFCTNVNVYFVGVWDCVASVGIVPRKLPFSKSPTNSVRHFRHAMALDEHRAKFKVAHWQTSVVDSSKADVHNETAEQTGGGGGGGFFKRFSKKPPIPAADAAVATNGASGQSKPSATSHRGGQKLARQTSLEAKFDAQNETRKLAQMVPPDVKEVWFIGCHADIGGGSEPNTARHMLSRIPLRWMLRQCFECDTGILFDTVRLAQQGLDVHNLWPVYQPASVPRVGPPPSLVAKKEAGLLAELKRRSTFLRIGEEDDMIEDAPTAEDLQYVLPSESTESFFDCTAQVNDQLVDAKGWWVLEYWPIKYRVLAKDGCWEKVVGLNRGRHRAIRDTAPMMHWTVKYMIDEGNYVVKARVDKKNTTWQLVA
jgi:uncharacterized protein (DUF2235 family)